MPTTEWLKKEFIYGYDSGNILSPFPNWTRYKEEKLVGGSYKKIFYQAILPILKRNSKVLEIGPGRGSWSRAILKYLLEGELTTIDFIDVTAWLNPVKYNGRLKCVKVDDYDFLPLSDNYFDFVWSFGVLCHNNQTAIYKILESLLAKVKTGGKAMHQYGDWDKLDQLKWRKGCPPIRFKDLSDDEIWWPRNNQKIMTEISEKAGWNVLTSDLGLLKRDSIILMQKL